jgi:hypothetical protein
VSRQKFCSLAGLVTRHTIKCAKKEQSMRSPSRACTKSGINEVSAFAPIPNSPNRGGRIVEGRDGLKQLEIENNCRRVSQINAMIADFGRTANELESWIQTEQERTRILDSRDPAYSTTARAMAQRRDNLKRSIDELERQLVSAAGS